MNSPARFGTVAIVGRTNVGKSTFLNQVLGQRLAIVSPLPQTTRDDLLGVLSLPTAQIAFTDTPGLHRPKTELGRRMNAIALDSVRSHDVVLFVTDIGRRVSGPRFKPETDLVHPDDRGLLKALSPDTPCVLMLNKVDLVRDKGRLLPLLSAFQEAFPFRAIIPTSASRADGLDRVLEMLVSLLPEGEAKFDADTLTDKPASFFAREMVREQIMQLTHREVPHAVAVTVDRFEDREKLSVIQATIHVEKLGQRAILVGRKGEQIKEIGTRARLQLEELLGRQVHLELFVRVTERWKDVPRQLQELGYEYAHGKQLTNLLPERAKTAPRKAKARPAERAGKKTSKRTFRGMGKAPGNSGGASRPARPRPGSVIPVGSAARSAAAKSNSSGSSKPRTGGKKTARRPTTSSRKTRP
jgi:GTPase